MDKITQDDDDLKEHNTTNPRALKKRWYSEITLAQKEFENWYKDCSKAYDRYIDKRNRALDYYDTSLRKKFNILWSNIQTFRPLLYARTPIPQVERRHKDSDPLARLTGEVLERSLNYQIKLYPFDRVMSLSVLDNLLAARGTARISYYPDFQNMPAESSDAGGQLESYQQIIEQTVKCEYIHWTDFLHQPARIWEEVTWIAYRHYYSRKECVKEFGEKVGRKIKLNYSANSNKDDHQRPEHEYLKRAEVWEVWDKETKTIIWLTEGYPEALKVEDDKLGLKDFFDCPEPLYGTLNTNSLVPVPDYLMYINQAQELDLITDRISKIIKSINPKALYDSSLTSISRLISEANDNDYIPIEGWRNFVQQGGIDGAIFFAPIQEKMQVVAQLYEARNSIISEIYEITGLSDIVRGASDPSETATAQQIKGQYANLRLSSRQQDVQRYARDLLSISGEIIAEHFEPQIIREISGYDYMSDANPQDPQEWDQIIGLLKNDPFRRFRINIETDSTVAINEQIDKQNRAEFIQTISSLMGELVPFTEGRPALASVASHLINFSARGLKAGRQIETELQAALEQWVEQVSQPPEPEPEVQPDQAKLAEIRANAQVEQAKMQIQVQEIQQKYELELQKLQKQYEVDSAKIALETEKNNKQLAMEAEKLRQSDVTNTLKALEIHQANGSQPVRLALANGKGKVSRKISMSRDESGHLIGQTIEMHGPDKFGNFVEKRKKHIIRRDEDGKLRGTTELELEQALLGNPIPNSKQEYVISHLPDGGIEAESIEMESDAT
jgi:hypothetical protein